MKFSVYRSDDEGITKYIVNASVVISITEADIIIIITIIVLIITIIIITNELRYYDLE